jgi:hypothetical protein
MLRGISDDGHRQETVVVWWMIHNLAPEYPLHDVMRSTYHATHVSMSEMGITGDDDEGVIVDTS